jgi:hypothetical protein
MRPLTVRPYQLMCLVCRQAAGFGEDPRDRQLQRILTALRRNPDRPLTLRCNVAGTYAYQNPGRDDDTPEGALFNLKRDLDLLQRLGLTPGATRPARELLTRLFATITTSRGFCAYDTVTSPTWQGCPEAASGHYEQGVAAGLAALLPPRDPESLDRAKQESAAAMHRAGVLEIRPHHLMCMTCFHDGRVDLAPIPEDNLFEAIDLLQKNPEIPVKLVTADVCTICPPCPGWNPQTRKCVAGCDLRDQKKDLDVLQKLDLQYGDVLPARELLRRLYAAVHSTREICGWGDGIVRSPEWSVCHAPESEAYARGRAAGLGLPSVPSS